MPSERVAVAVLRAWIEADPTHGLRVRVTDVIDVETGSQRVHPVVSSIEGVCAIVRDWLIAFVESTPGPSPNDRLPREPADDDPAVTPP